MSSGGPFYSDDTVAGNYSGIITRKWRYRQQAPFTHPLPYRMFECFSTTLPNPWGLSYDRTFSTSSEIDVANAIALNKAYASFKDQVLGVQASSAVNLAERKQAIDMIARRGAQVLSFAKHLRSFNFPAACRDLGFDIITTSTSKRKKNAYWRARVRRNGVDREVKLKRSAKAFGDNFLEFHFGWEPAVKDIHAALELSCSAEFLGLRNKVVGKGSVRSLLSKGVVATAKGTYGARTEYPFSSVKIGGTVSIDNRNSLLLNQYGVTNPAVVLWELIPFSFIVDWFTSVGDVLSSYTDFIGLTIVDGYTTFMNKKVDTTFYTDYANYYTPPLVTSGYRRSESVYVGRSLGVTGPVLAVKQLKLPSVTRGLTAVSLLAQFLKN